MADNVAITAGAGTTVAADEVTDATLGTVKIQYVKLMDGTLDSTNKLIVDETGSVNVSDTKLRNTVEASYLMQYASSMALLDPMRGFEIR